MKRLIVYIVLVVISCVAVSGFFVDKQLKAQNIYYGAAMEIPEETLEQAIWAARSSAAAFKISFETKVRAYARIDDMNMERAEETGLECMVTDSLRLVRVICFKERAKRKPSSTNWFERNLKNWFLENGINKVGMKYDTDRKVVQAGVALVANKDCRTCHNKTYKPGELIGAMVFDIRYKGDNHTKQLSYLAPSLK